MINIGFIDDEKNVFDDYEYRLRKHGISLLFVENCTTKEDIKRWILENRIECMLVDFKLNQMYEFSGVEFVEYINSELPDLQCVVISNFPEEGIAKNLVARSTVLDRNQFEDEVQEVAQILIQATEVFRNRLVLRREEFAVIKQKKDNGTISSVDDERFLTLFKLLRAYGEVDDIPDALLTPAISLKMDRILDQLDKLIEKTE